MSYRYHRQRTYTQFTTMNTHPCEEKCRLCWLSAVDMSNNNITFRFERLGIIRGCTYVHHRDRQKSRAITLFPPHNINGGNNAGCILAVLHGSGLSKDASWREEDETREALAGNYRKRQISKRVCLPISWAVWNSPDLTTVRISLPSPHLSLSMYSQAAS